MIWMGYYQFDITTTPKEPGIGWIAGRSAREFFVPNNLLQQRSQPGIRERHVIFNFNTSTGHLSVLSRGSNNGLSQVNVNGQNVLRGGSHALNQRDMKIRLGSFEYLFEYTPFAHTREFREQRQVYIRQSLGLEVNIDLAPTPIGKPWVFGSWTIDHSLGKGASGRVYRATDVKGQIAVLKFVERHLAKTGSIEKEIRTLQSLTRLAQKEDSEGRLLLLRDVIRHNGHVGAKWEDVALVLQPVADETMQMLVEAAG